MREARKLRVNIGPRWKAELCAVARGEMPLRWYIWMQTADYIAGQRAKQAALAAVTKHTAPMRVRLGGNGGALGLEFGRPSIPIT